MQMNQMGRTLIGPDRIFSRFVSREVVHHHRNSNHNTRSKTHGTQYIPKPEGVYSASTNHRNQSGGPTWRMYSIGQLHCHDGQGDRQRAGKHSLITQQQINGDANQCGDAVPTDEVARLGEGSLGGTIGKYRRGSERTDQEEGGPVTQIDHSSDLFD